MYGSSPPPFGNGMAAAAARRKAIMMTRRGLAAAMAAGGRGARRNAGGGRTRQRLGCVMKSSELVCARAIMGLFGWVTHYDLSKFGCVKIWLCQSWSHAKNRNSKCFVHGQAEVWLC